MAKVMLMWNPNKKHTDIERWICLYPAYINSKKTLAEGRKLPKKYCVDNPTHQEIIDVLKPTGLLAGVEDKLHPRERSKEMVYQGRVRIQLKNNDGTPKKAEYPTRESIMRYVGESIPKLKTRQNRPAEQQQAQAAQVSSKGKGKKGRR